MKRPCVVFTLSNLLFNLNTSKDYVRLTILWHFLALGGFCLEISSWLLRILAAVVLGLALIRALLDSKPHPELRAFAYKENRFGIIHKNGQEKVYQRLHICVNAVLFTLLRFKGGAGCRYVVLFHDQLSTEALKTLYVIARTKH